MKIVYQLDRLFAAICTISRGILLGTVFLDFFYWGTPKKAELFLAGVLISSAVMDSPLWGVMRLAHVPPLPLWHIQGENEFAITWSLWEWTVYYYNPIGGYQVWKDYWLASGLPTAAMIFWSIALRVILAAVLIIW